MSVISMDPFAVAPPVGLKCMLLTGFKSETSLNGKIVSALVTQRPNDDRVAVQVFDDDRRIRVKPENLRPLC